MNAAERRSRVTRLQIVSILIALIGGGISIPVAFSRPEVFYPAYLVAFMFVLSIALGCLAIVMIHNLTGGVWGIELRQVLQEGFILLPLVGLLFIPLIFGLPTLYPWSRPEVVSADAILQGKAKYLNVDAFQWRAIGYFVIWILLAIAHYRLKPQTLAEGSGFRRRFSGPGLILWVLTVTFASVDWVMSLEPHWSSSMYGVLFIGAQGVSALAFGIVMLAMSRQAEPTIPGEPSVERPWSDLGNLLLAFVLFWSYVSFMQYLIIWSGNLPEESPWYLNRTRGGWEYVALALLGMHFLLPFLLLLSRETKRRPTRLFKVALLLLFMRLIDLWWLVVPAFHPGKFYFHWLYLVAPLAMASLWLAIFLWRLLAQMRLKESESPALRGGVA